MTMRGIMMVVAALTCGAAAAFGVSRMNRPEIVAAEVETTPVLVAVADLPRGRMIAAGDVMVKEWPKALLPAGAIKAPDDAMDRATIGALVAGEVLLEGKLAARDAGRGLAALVPKGMRAYTIQTSKVAASVAGFVMPGNKVDVLLSLRDMRQDDETGGGSTTTLLQAVEILAVDQRLDAPSENKVNPKDLQSVTLLVTPQQAAMLDLGQNLGTLSLSLRNIEDKLDSAVRPATLTDLRFRQMKAEAPKAAPAPPPAAAPAPPKKEEPKVYAVRTLRGSQWGSIEVRQEK